jgi:hypothetical protein
MEEDRMSDESHQMVLQTEYETGAEEWWCPACGRRFVAQWAPKYKRIILSEGNGQARHGGGKGDLQVLSLDVSEPGAAAREEQRLEPWANWAESADFEGLWSTPFGDSPDLE